MGNTLSRPPLVEALLEVKWQLTEEIPDSGIFVDRGFEVAHIQMAQIVKDQFPFIEALPAASIPLQVTPHIPKYRYRISENEWPVIQLGAGIATLNFTEPYTWSLFLEQADYFLSSLQKAYNSHELKFTDVQLRYINAEIFDYKHNNVLEFIQAHLNTNLQLPMNVIHSSASPPSSATWSIEYPLEKPKGVGTIRFSTGTLSKDDANTKAVIWEILVRSSGSEAPQFAQESQKDMLMWLELAHNVVEKWFFALIQGQLLEKYRLGGGNDFGK